MDTVKIWVLLAIGLPLLGGPLIALAGRRLGHRVGWLALAFPVISTGSLLALAATMDLPGRIVVEWPWIPSLGLNLTFLVDGLSLFFGLVVSVMGCLIMYYAIYYMGHDYEHLGRFFCYLVLFMASMLGTVFADHMVLLFIFWELTGIASFLLIGFLHEEEDSRVGARQALLVTAGTGFALFVGIILLQQATGTSSLSTLLAEGLPWEQHGGILSIALVLMIIGAFGKSAQFPLHFWLPNAMAAPTPVSAYLHSATMVKLGVFLAARIYPLFVGHEWWPLILGTIAFTTMVLGAVLALLSHDLKAILAFSTVSQLGFLIGYYGLGPVDGVEYDYLHILNHVFYKGGLFMVVGIVAHAAGIRDIRQLGGLFRRMPLLGTTTLIAAATMAGLPGTTGFLSKEMMLKEIFEAMRDRSVLGIYATACVAVGTMVKVAFSFRLFANIFLGPEPEQVRNNFHAPSLWMQLPPAFLAGCALVFGLFPSLLDGPFHALGVEGLNRPQHLVVWHGFTRELVASILVVVLGFGLYWLGQKTDWRWHNIPGWLRFDVMFEVGLEGFSKFTKTVTRFLRSDEPVDYLPIIVTFFVCLVGGGFVWNLSPLAAAIVPDWNTVHPLRALTAALIALAVIGVLILRLWTAQLISLSVAGFLTCFYFVLYRAPDLALTQILVETVTIILVLLLLARFPRSAQVGEETRQPIRIRRSFHMLLALSVGLMATLLVLAVTADPHPAPIGTGFLEHTVDLAKGSNAVNTILVDFRGLDTLGEITVLVITTLGSLGLLMRYKRTPEEYKQGPLGPPGFGVDDKRKD
jgi:NADH:ubiquinone oxidoreductase subunit 5 (subunit L)/multisubunit Na+/H+ antiporter MnhA subunit/multisubunit Na+/H+ antiporter MnhB subunit